jgi:hypothetical protein
MQRRRALQFAAASTLMMTESLFAFPSDQPSSHRANTSWVEEVLRLMQTIRPGETRLELLRVFTTEGGISTPLQRTFVSRDCPYFKVDVAFQAVGRPERDHDGRVTMLEDVRDIILSLSRPYLAWTIAD